MHASKEDNFLKITSCELTRLMWDSLMTKARSFHNLTRKQRWQFFENHKLWVDMFDVGCIKKLKKFNVTWIENLLVFPPHLVMLTLLNCLRISKISFMSFVSGRWRCWYGWLKTNTGWPRHVSEDNKGRHSSELALDYLCTALLPCWKTSSHQEQINFSFEDLKRNPSS